MSDPQSQLRLPLQGVDLCLAAVSFVPEHTELSGNSWLSGEDSFFFRVPGTGSFCAREGRIVEYEPELSADPGWLRLCLNTQMTVALLHQRGIMSFHAGSFEYKGKGIIVSGETGAGKTSLTLSFSLNGGSFISDDLTPVIFRDGNPYIHPLHMQAKLREDTIEQLNISPRDLQDAEAGTGKYYLGIGNGIGYHQLDLILIIETGDCSKPEFIEPGISEKFSILRSGICMWEILEGMPATETEYFTQLMKLVGSVKIIKVIRPSGIRIADFHDTVKCYLDKEFS